MTQTQSKAEVAQQISQVPAQTGLASLLSSKRTFWKIALTAAVVSLSLLAVVRVQTSQPVTPLYGSFISAKSFLMQRAKITTFSVSPESKPRSTSGPGCQPVLERATNGEWVPRPHSVGERLEVETFLNRVKTYQKLPFSMQRKDMRCGNVNMKEKGSPGGHVWYKGLCDPAGRTPCCHSNHKCVDLSVEKCRCEGCQDLRQQVHAELSTWAPHDKTCKLKYFSDESDLCPLLHNSTVHVMGDSFMRQVFISMLGFLRSRYPNGVIKNATAARIQHCDKYYRYFSKCADVIPTSATECEGMVRFYRSSLWRASQITKILAEFKKYVGVPNTFVIFGQGIHDMYHPKVTIEKVLNPVLSLLGKSPPWPQLIWVAPQTVGLMKTPLVKQQQEKSVASFNAVVTPYLKSRGIPVLDGFNITQGSLTSYDGTHFGKGVNDLKAQLLFNFFDELWER